MVSVFPKFLIILLRSIYLYINFFQRCFKPLHASIIYLSFHISLLSLYKVIAILIQTYKFKMPYTEINGFVVSYQPILISFVTTAY